MSQETNSNQHSLEAETRIVRYVSLLLAVAGFAAALLIASQSAG